MVNQTQLVIYSPLGGLGGALNEIPQCDHDDEQVCDRNKQHTVAAGMSKQPIVENKKSKDNLFNEDLQMKRKTQEVNQKLQEHRS